MTHPSKNVVWLDVDDKLRKCRVSDVIMHFFMKLQPSRHPEKPGLMVDPIKVYRKHFEESSKWLSKEDVKRKRKALLASEVVRVSAFELVED